MFTVRHSLVHIDQMKGAIGSTSGRVRPIKQELAAAQWPAVNARDYTHDPLKNDPVFAQ